jgi:tripartite-type tricarboxylate transporter receptor subunit TctC
MKKIIVSFFLVSVIISLAFLFMGVLPTPASALDYPTKPIQLIVPNPPGGTNDIVARVLAPKLASVLGQAVPIVNKVGGGGAVGIKYASTSKPDGYTFLTSPPAIVLVPILDPGIGYKLADFSPVGLAVSSIFLIVVKGDSPWQTLDDLVKDAKKTPGKLTYSSAGQGTLFHFAGELFKVQTGTDVVHVPMPGEAGALTGMLGGHVDMSVLSKTLAAPHLKSGTLRALAVMDQKRLSDFPNIPTSGELGYPRMLATGWHGYFFPAKTPKVIVEKVARVFDAAFKDKEVIANIDKTGMIVQNLILGEATKFFNDEEKKWSEVGKKIKMDEAKK